LRGKATREGGRERRKKGGGREEGKRSRCPSFLPFQLPLGKRRKKRITNDN